MQQKSRAALKLMTLLLHGIQLPAVPKKAPKRATLTITHNSLNESWHLLELGSFLWWGTPATHLLHPVTSYQLHFSTKESVKCELDTFLPDYPLWAEGTLMLVFLV